MSNETTVTFNGHNFARTKKVFLSGSFKGYYRRSKNGVLLMDENKLPVAFVVTSGTAFVVTASKQPKGIFYMHGTTKSTKKFLGIESMDLAANRECCDEFKKSLAA